MSILTLMIVAITGIVVFSYKMSRDRVYPVGIVRKSSTFQVEETAPSTSDLRVLDYDKLDYLAREI